MKKNNNLLLFFVLLSLVAQTACEKAKAQNEELVPPSVVEPIPPTVVPVPPSVETPGNNNKPKQYDIVRFGNYQQNDERKLPIEWVVLAVENDKYLLLSRNLLSSRPWDETGQNLTYDRSSIRQWLNGAFFTTAFSASEADDILPTELDNSDQNGYGTPAGQKTTDKVFLLSVNEFNTYLRGSGSAYATSAPTEIAKREGAYANGRGNAAWWLRSPGSRADSPAYLSSGANLGVNAHKATENIIGTRPAVWVRIKN